MGLAYASRDANGDQQLRVECELPQKLPPELTAVPIRSDKEHDPCEDIVGTC
jgi:hypothetical protein